ncbi:aspartate aminotransferase family protein [Kamptonema animale CS-326]|jgi:glutamate-1-semialdehyde 2,1-aminomutase|uniref:aspartate aminotransferase family protein n=1 Tax=Kamptonema animale TaxID=92934 RepID=UPI00232C5723|nr:aspartate aminotransferase family protein [Kamptonema animale]MDB9510443.1 aspartate aminotransferase family protein [Kamptonema animale CS-326]
MNDRLQQKHLEALLARYIQRTKTSKQLAQKYRSVLADNRAADGFRFPVKEMFYPIVAKQSLGSRMWDVDDNEYIDITMGFGINLFGHNPPFIKEAILEQMDRGVQIGPQSELAGEVAELISKLTGMERVAFSNTGTEAVMTALRLARAATGRNKIALFSGSYHGHFDGTLAIAKEVDGHLHTLPKASGIPSNFVENVLVLDYGNPQSLEIIKANQQELAAVLVEPIQSFRPDFQPKEFLYELRQLTKETGIALIFDEMVTGFRIDLGGVQALFGIQADITTYGKIVGGGMPIGIVAGKATYLDKIDGGMWNYGDESYPQVKTTIFAGTFCKHPLAMAAARTVLQYLIAQGPSLQQQLNQRTSELVKTLNVYFKEQEIPIWLVNFGSQFRPAASTNIDPLLFHLLEKGLYICEGRSCFLSTAHSNEDISTIIQVVKDSVQEMRAGGFFPVYSN